MAKIKHNPHIDEMIGAHSKNGTVERRKVFRDYDGNVTKIGRLEAYIPNPRNYKANPIIGGELLNQKSFGNASHLAQEFIDALKNKTPLSPEKQALLNSYKDRFYKQLKGKPDPIAPKDKNGNYTIYARIDNFIRAILRKENPSFPA
jgi:hypothetical protein